MEQGKTPMNEKEMVQFRMRVAKDLVELAGRFTAMDMGYIMSVLMFHNAYKIAEAKGALDILASGLAKINEMIIGPVDGEKREVGHA